MTITWCMVPEISMRYQVWWTEFFVILNHFLPFYQPNNPKKQNLEKMKKMPEDIIILRMFTINHNHIMYCSWDMKCDEQNFLSFWTAFCPFTPLTTWKIKILKNWKKTPEDIIILHNYMIDGSWDMKYDRKNFLSFWTIFLPFHPLKTQKIKILKKMKKRTGDIIILHKCTKNHDHMLHCSWDMMWDRCNSYLLFWAIFCPFTPTPNNPKNENLRKKWKNTRRSDGWMDKQMDRGTNRWTENVTYRGGCPT